MFCLHKVIQNAVQQEDIFIADLKIVESLLLDLAKALFLNSSLACTGTISTRNVLMFMHVYYGNTMSSGREMHSVTVGLPVKNVTTIPTHCDALNAGSSKQLLS